MPRPKGSKNRKTPVAAAPDANVEAISKEIEELTAALKAKKAELKKALQAKAKAEKAAAAKQAAEDKARLLKAVAASGKTVDEVLELLK